MTKFTKGTWKVENCTEVRSTEDSNFICETNFSTVYGRKNKSATKEQVANAQLISAAPDLYEALLEVYEDISQGAIPNKDDDIWIDIKKALAKAEGN